MVETVQLESMPSVFLKPYDPLDKMIHSISAAFVRHGDSVRLRGLPKKVYCFRHPDQAMEILTHKRIGGLKFPPMMPRVKWAMGDGAYVLAGGESWRQRRRVAQPAFARDAAAGALMSTAVIAARHIERWRQAAPSGEPFDIYRALQELVNDVSFQTFFGTDLGPNLATVTDQTYFLESNFTRLSPPWVPLKDNRRFSQECEALRARLREIVTSRRHDGANDLIALLIGEFGDSAGAAENAVDEMMSIYFGMSVMAVTLSWGLYLLSTHAEAQTRLRAEAASLYCEPAENWPKVLAQLEFSDWVLQEVTRLYPPSWGFPRHAAEAVEIGGHPIPTGSIVIPMIYDVQRHPDFWPEPERFDPERFAPARAAGRHPFAHFPYGGGLRKCLGANVAPAMMQLIMLLVVARCELIHAPRFAGDPMPEFGFELRPKDKVMLRLRDAPIPDSVAPVRVSSPSCPRHTIGA
jgi:enediyne biosynthesis protein E7